MSGHSKWSTIKHKKASQDARRGKIFSRLSKEITVAAKLGGGNPDQNPSLRLLIDNARTANMPKDNIEKAIKKGTGELPGIIYESYTYEAYAPNGIALIIEILTDNKNRTAAEIRHTLSKNNGNLAESGSVSYQFKRKGFIVIKKETIDEEKLFNMVIEANAEDLKLEGEFYEITTQVKDFMNVVNTIRQSEIPIESYEITYIPDNLMTLDVEKAKKVLKLLNALDDLVDIRSVSSNLDIPDELLSE